jgi:hypothetical protein
MNQHIQKSVGHIGWFHRPDGQLCELYEDGGELFTAPVSNVIDLDTGNRIGRFEAPLHMLTYVKQYLKVEE